jgi:hypothetical protein
MEGHRSAPVRTPALPRSPRGKKDDLDAIGDSRRPAALAYAQDNVVALPKSRMKAE